MYFIERQYSYLKSNFVKVSSYGFIQQRFGSSDCMAPEGPWAFLSQWQIHWHIYTSPWLNVFNVLHVHFMMSNTVRIRLLPKWYISLNHISFTLFLPKFLIQSSVWVKSDHEIVQRLFPSRLLSNHPAYTTEIFLSQLECPWSLLIAIWNIINVLTQWRLNEHGRCGQSGISKIFVLYKTSCILIQLALQFSPLGVIHYNGIPSASWRLKSSVTELCFRDLVLTKRSVSLATCEGNLPVDSSHKGLVMPEMFPFYNDSTAQQISIVSGNALGQKIVLTHCLHWTWRCIIA